MRWVWLASALVLTASCESEPSPEPPAPVEETVAAPAQVEETVTVATPAPSSEALRARIELREVALTSGRERALRDEVTERARPMLAQCIQSARSRGALRPGALELAVRVRDGKVEEVEVSSADPAVTDVGTCARMKVRAWRFRADVSGTFRIGASIVP